MHAVDVVLYSPCLLTGLLGSLACLTLLTVLGEWNALSYCGNGQITN